MRRPRVRWRRGLALLLAVLAAVVAGLWFAPSDQYLLLPDRARLVEPLVEIANEEDDPDEEGGIFMVDILVRKANLFERLFPGVNEGATLVPEQQFNPDGVSERQRRQSSNLDMTRSQEIAAAVALRSLGYTVDATPSGAEVFTVVPGSPAAAAGLEPGDVIVEAQGAVVETPGDLRDAFDPIEPGEEVTIRVRRSGGVSEYAIVTRASEEEPERAVIGVRVQQSATIELPVEIEIDAGSVGGPSAGLAFALDIVDELGADLDRGRTIVVTGQLELDGSVEPIGGVKQKAIGARRAGAELFIVPAGNAEDAERYADGLDVVAVETFGEALEALGVPSAVS